ncbi:salicylate 1-hydroxylase-like protein [Lindgomyces ingoldianus]|uniref:Salicylate 1-hydroxylase-like protein n=1 Tax=Lindgomyces ingoldianus TaxID=673940 RepID=A0ACB6QR62_9PLEO|nr:salicylate 1-hydroxylase-like protein [Lindgomyces ingoldianus]KAF2468575.1 salicylate 1-hydroxylase-like protein [Lindgomyces ingoldianus]
MGSSLPPKPFNIAIIGGGIAGLTLTISLLKHNIPLTLYEAASQFEEIGAGVGFEPCMVRIMDLISPGIKEGFLRCANNVELDPPLWFTVRVGDRRKEDEEGVVLQKDGRKIRLGEPIFEMPARRGPRGGVHRAQFLDELVKLVPADVAKFRKKLVNITRADDGSDDAVLHFADGTTAQHSAVIGCDGIKSRTREVVLGKDEAQPVFSGKYVYRGLIPMQKAKEIMGEQEPTTPQMYVGYSGHVLTFPIANGTIMNVVAFSSKAEWNDPEWVVETSREQMCSDYTRWSPTVQAIMANMKNPDIWALFNHGTPARTYFRTQPRICLVGDAAHATTPHQGSGAGMCIEDCYILGELLGEANSTHDLEAVFRAYDEVRRPRSLKLVQTSREAGMLWELQGPKGDDLEALERDALERMNWIWDHDLTKDLDQAKMLLKQQ